MTTGATQEKPTFAKGDRVMLQHDVEAFHFYPVGLKGVIESDNEPEPLYPFRVRFSNGHAINCTLARLEESFAKAVGG